MRKRRGRFKMTIGARIPWPGVQALEIDKAFGINPAPPIATIHACGCWMIQLAQRKAFFACAGHEPKILDLLVTK